MELNFWTIFYRAILIIAVGLVTFWVIIRINRRYTKERFAFSARASIMTLTFALFASLATNLMPWYLLAALLQLYFGEEIDVPEAVWYEQALMVLVYVVAVGGIVWIHRQWDGGKSVEQHKPEQRGKSSNLFGKAIKKWSRFIKREPAVVVEPDWRQFKPQSEGFSHSLAWEEQARELLQLSSSSYDFDSGRDHLINFRTYENDIRKRVETDLQPESKLTLSEVYVTAYFDLPNGERATQNVEQYLKTWLAEPGQRQLALLGEYGQGKSTTAQMLTYHLLQEGSPTRLPILIELRGKSPRNLRALEFFGAWAARYRIDPRALMQLHSVGRLLLIFDGFDEMALVGDAEMRLRHFQSLWQFSHPQAKIVITGRANFFLDDQEMKDFLGIRKPLGDGTPYCEALRLAPFELSQIESSLRAHKSLVREQICALAQRNHRFQDLISRPSLLHIVSVLWEREKLADKVQELNSAGVMDLFVRYSYRRQGLKKPDDPRNFMALTSLERAYFMSGVACYMAAEQLPNQIKKRELNQLIERLIKGIPDSVSTGSPAIRGETTKPLRQRLANASDRIEHVKTDVRACGLLVDDPAVPGTFRFAHQSFMAYLFAAIVAERIQNDHSEKTRALFKATTAKIEDLFEFSDALPLDFVSELVTTGYKECRLPIYRDAKSLLAADEKSVAHSLLQSISHQSISLWGSLLLRFSLFNHAFLRSLKNYGMIWRVISYLISPFVLVESAGLLALALIWYRHQSLTWGMWIILCLLLTLFVTLNAMLAHLAYRSREWKIGTQLQRQMRLWSNLCQQLNIPDHILHRVAGTWLLPWANKRPFDFFLDE